MDRLRFKCRERGGPITLYGETDTYEGTKIGKLLTFSPTSSADIVFDIAAIDATILGIPAEQESPTDEPKEEEDEGE
jgi:hypothetical protein